MEPTTLRARIREDLRRQFRGELLFDAPSRNLFATDASVFAIEPLAIAVPRDEDDLALLVRYAHERSIPLVPRGGGTGVAGESLGHGVIVDLSTHFRSILEVGSDWARVQPGVVLDRLNEQLAIYGRRFAPDPASSRSCTIGGMIATDASGGRAAIHGYTRDHLRSLRVVWDDGTIEDLADSFPERSWQPRTTEICNGVHELLRTNAEVIETCRPKTPFNRCGYRLENSSNLNLVRLLAGSEGTLAFTTEATLRTIPLAGGRAAVAFGFQTFEEALHAGLRARHTLPAACEVLDRRLISLARSQSPEAAAAMPPEVEAVLLVEYEREAPSEAREAVRLLIEEHQQTNLFVMPAYDQAEVKKLWAIRGSALPSLYALGKGRRPLAFVEDIGVCPDDLPEFVSRSNVILKRFDVMASFLVHAATGQMHLRPFLDPDDKEDAEKLWPIAEQLHGLAIELGGTISAQHGTGLARTPWVSRQYGKLFPVFQELKRQFDPRGILNPGKIVGPDPSRPAWPLRTNQSQALPVEPRESRAITPLLVWEPEEQNRAIAACNGCGTCRTEDSGQRMCPTFRVLHTEAASPRAKANMFRAVLEGKLDDASTEEFRAVADLCVNCKMCAGECPGKSNIPKLMLEAKAINHAKSGLRRTTWFMARIDGLASLGSKFSLSSNFLLRRQPVRWLLEKTFGLSRKRTLPSFAFRTFLGRARRRGWTKRPDSGPAVAYFVDTFANLFDPGIAEATLAVLSHNGIPFYVPARQCGTGSAALAQGDTDVARERLTANIRVLADAARAGDTIVCSEPTAALFFKLDAFGLLDDPDVRSVASRTVELTAYLWSLHQEGRLRTDFQPIEMSIGHHVPCHVKALGEGIHGPALLSLIPGVQVNKIDVSCSGMAGPYGLNAQNLPTSLAAGKPMLDELARPRHLYGSTECSSCRLQMQEGTGKRTLHPVQYLALAYGLMPSIADRLKRPLQAMVSS